MVKYRMSRQRSYSLREGSVIQRRGREFGIAGGLKKSGRKGSSTICQRPGLEERKPQSGGGGEKKRLHKGGKTDVHGNKRNN